MSPALEREFFHAVAMWLSARLYALEGGEYYLPGPILGELDAGAEAAIILEEERIVRTLRVSDPRVSLDERGLIL